MDANESAREAAERLAVRLAVVVADVLLVYLGSVGGGTGLADDALSRPDELVYMYEPGDADEAPAPRPLRDASGDAVIAADAAEPFEPLVAAVPLVGALPLVAAVPFEAEWPLTPLTPLMVTSPVHRGKSPVRGGALDALLDTHEHARAHGAVDAPEALRPRHVAGTSRPRGCTTTPCRTDHGHALTDGAESGERASGTTEWW